MIFDVSSPDGRCRVVELDLVEFDSVEVWHGCVRLCVGRCRVGGSVLVDSRIDSRAGRRGCEMEGV